MLALFKLQKRQRTKAKKKDRVRTPVVRAPAPVRIAAPLPPSPRTHGTSHRPAIAVSDSKRPSAYVATRPATIFPAASSAGDDGGGDEISVNNSDVAAALNAEIKAIRAYYDKKIAVAPPSAKAALKAQRSAAVKAAKEKARAAKAGRKRHKPVRSRRKVQCSPKP